MYIELELPHPPSINSYWLSGRGGHKFLSKRALKFRQDVEIILKQNNLYNLKNEERLFYYCEYFAPDKRKRDIDNFCTKAVLDALKESGLFVDDCQIDEIHYKRMPEIIKNGKLKIIIKNI